ncbi:type II secretion system protein N [Sphingosinicella sp. CPCC 101087]|uniref:type II secretion system protein N n=1 Tax=Sphingosinicella sp. CPCC 101087 TaxID=2497754 RepID=UPI00101C76A4|nr:type II secretion system protein N [Sphingosinicella sp. CPCC 101087]
MRLRSIPRADRLLGRFPHLTAFSAAELLLLALIAMQAARLVWIVVTPVGPVGDYKGATPLLPPGDSALADFDPFFRLAGGGAAVVTSLNLSLHGIREDRATGRGSAIIALPDGSQHSFGVGEEIMPGVTLAEVGFESVTIRRNGALEQVFLDQSGSVPPAAPVPGAPASNAVSAPTGPAPVPAQPSSAAPAAPPIRFQTRMNEGRVDGIIVAPGDDGGQAFRAAGFAPGDVIVSVNGQRISSPEQARALVQGSNGRATVLVDRAGRTVPIVVRLDL